MDKIEATGPNQRCLQKGSVWDAWLKPVNSTGLHHASRQRDLRATRQRRTHGCDREMQKAFGMMLASAKRPSQTPAFRLQEEQSRPHTVRRGGYPQRPPAPAP